MDMLVRFPDGYHLMSPEVDIMIRIIQKQNCTIVFHFPNSHFPNTVLPDPNNVFKQEVTIGKLWDHTERIRTDVPNIARIVNAVQCHS